jgi:hypothetical protein
LSFCPQLKGENKIKTRTKYPHVGSHGGRGFSSVVFKKPVGITGFILKITVLV